MDELTAALEKTRNDLDITRQRLSFTQNSLSDRDHELSRIREDHSKQLTEILQLKQQVLMTAASDRDMGIKLLDFPPFRNKTSPEEVITLRTDDRFMSHLKQQAHSRMKDMIKEHYEDGHIHQPYSQHLHHREQREQISPPPEQDDEDGIWA
ncbi:ERC protein 2-like [Myxocyprinus asiaticus]|uniref:ERC protein 2-like n=1 Tax=Myxocyprinus asiaticus TaxID=70543 RepID=UPI002221EAD6|nr:ERC protein 2-like [Myxocyprinus asiaticus]